MAHPFEKLFSDALKQSTDFDNVVLERASDLHSKGYAGKEIAQVLKKFAGSLIDPQEAAVVREAYEEFASFLEE